LSLLATHALAFSLFFFFVAKQTAKHKKKATFIQSLINLIAENSKKRIQRREFKEENSKKSNHWKLFLYTLKKNGPTKQKVVYGKFNNLVMKEMYETLQKIFWLKFNFKSGVK
jgi:hypothetical protein